MTYLTGKFIKTKGFIMRLLPLFGYEISKTKQKNRLKKLHSSNAVLQFLKETSTKKELIVAEVGVWKAGTTVEILKLLPIKKIYAIDPWTTYGSSSHHEEVMDTAERESRKKLSKFGSKVEIIKKFSSEAAKEIKEELDFVYIDGNHDYEFVKKDIEDYYVLLKEGGILSGDDIENGEVQNGVSKALTEFVVKNKLEFYIRKNNWWLIKPTELGGKHETT